MKLRALYLIALLPFFSCSRQLLNRNSSKTESSKNTPMAVIFETDMGNDVDDVLALDMLYKYQEAGKIKLLAISTNKDDPFSAPFLNVMNTWYGYQNIPIGTVSDGYDCTKYVNYAKEVVELKDKNGKPVFPQTPTKYTDAVKLYRRILSQQPDHSVTVISVGFLTNLARLLNSPADNYSKLTGKELVAKKIKNLFTMAGCFSSKPHREFNIIYDIPSAEIVYREWPSPIVNAPWEIGDKVRFPGKTIVDGFKWATNNPLVTAYSVYKPMPYDRPCWDLITVLTAIEPDNTQYFTYSAPGEIRVKNKGDNKDLTIFIPTANGIHRNVSANAQQAENMKKRFVEVISQCPKNYKNK